MIETEQPTYDDGWRVVLRDELGDAAARLPSKEAADLFADAPRVLALVDTLRESLRTMEAAHLDKSDALDRVLAERDRLRKACEAIAGGYVPRSQPFESAIAAGDTTAFRAAFVSWAQGIASAALQEPEANHAT